MKNVLLIIALALFGFRAAAQQYRPFVEEGKTWRVASISPRNDDLTYPVDHEYYFMKGDTIVAGKTWKKVYHTSSSKFDFLVREENKRVYYAPYPGREELMYDFNVAVGDTVAYRDIREFYNGDATEDYEKYCRNWDSIAVETIDEVKDKAGHAYRCYGLYRKWTYNYHDPEDYNKEVQVGEAWDTWVECLGNPFNPFKHDISNPTWILGSWTNVLEECSVGDEILYHRDLNSITAPKLDATDKAPIYDLSGRRLQAIPQRGVYIVNGKKYIR
jgi:hypothetical protein